VIGFKNIGTLEDGKSGIGGDTLAPSADYLANEQVEGGTEVVDAISGDSAPPGRGLAGYAGLVDQISRIRLVITDSFIGVGLSEPLVEGFEITEVMFGPFDLYPDPGEIGLAGHD